jgi:hypothetical protein
VRELIQDFLISLYCSPGQLEHSGASLGLIVLNEIVTVAQMSASIHALSSPLARTNITVFERTLEKFKSGLKKNDREMFKETTVESLKQAMVSIQAEQLSTRRQKGLKRLAPFIEAIGNLGEVVQVSVMPTNSLLLSM